MDSKAGKWKGQQRLTETSATLAGSLCAIPLSGMPSTDRSPAELPISLQTSKASYTGRSRVSQAVASTSSIRGKRRKSKTNMYVSYGLASRLLRAEGSIRIIISTARQYATLARHVERLQRSFIRLHASTRTRRKRGFYHPTRVTLHPNWMITQSGPPAPHARQTA